MKLNALPSHIAFTLTDLAFRTIEIPALPALIGRKEADIVIEHPSVSDTHARLELIDGSLIIRDLGSRNGTFVNGKLVSRHASVRNKDHLTIGTVTYKVSLVSRLPSKKGATVDSNNLTFPLNSGEGKLDGQETRPVMLVIRTAGTQRQFLLDKRVSTVGRQSNDIRVSDPALSRRHFQIEIYADHVCLKDLASANGTLVNGNPISYCRVQDDLTFTAGESTINLVAGFRR